MFAVILIFGNLLLRIAGKIAKSVKIRTLPPQISCNKVVKMHINSKQKRNTAKQKPHQKLERKRKSCFRLLTSFMDRRHSISKKITYVPNNVMH